MPVASATPQTVRRAAELLRNGGVVAFPTETVYGLGADAFDAQAVARIFEIKRRPLFDPLIVHVAGEEMLARVVRDVSARARMLVERFWPGPLTLVFERSDAVPLLVTAGLATVAVRMPAHPVALALLHEARVPIAAPSANAFGALSPTRADRVARTLGERVDLILDGGPTPLGIESTILRLEPFPALLRPGALPVEEIEALIGPVERTVRGEHAPSWPGRLPQHYAPATPLRVIAPENVPITQRARAGFLGMSRSPEGYGAVRLLSSAGDLREAAARLFEALHELDDLGLERIDAEPVPQEGLGLAIADRLQRASRNRTGHCQ
ncbi:MAG TPA: L-threonylcarbamoyladenylate synthase [Candidatus Tyrphobacter sp.]